MGKIRETGMNKKISCFLLITGFISLIAWGSLWLLARADRASVTDPLFFGLLVLGGSSPTLAVFLTVAVIDGRQGFSDYWTRLFRFKVPLGYYLFPLVFLFLLGILPELLAGDLGDKLFALGQFPWVALPSILISSLLIGGLEEMGWRGVLQHELQDKYAPWIVHALIWIIWTLWHFPLFHIPGVSQFGQNYGLFAIYAPIFSTLLGWLYGRTQSIPLVVFGHMLINALATIGILDFLWVGRFDWRTVVIAMAILVGVHVLWPIKEPEQQNTVIPGD
jgi:hypothetical protein